MNHINSLIFVYLFFQNHIIHEKFYPRKYCAIRYWVYIWGYKGSGLITTLYCQDIIVSSRNQHSFLATFKTLAHYNLCVLVAMINLTIIKHMTEVWNKHIFWEIANSIKLISTWDYHNCYTEVVVTDEWCYYTINFQHNI